MAILKANMTICTAHDLKLISKYVLELPCLLQVLQVKGGCVYGLERVPSLQVSTIS